MEGEIEPTERDAAVDAIAKAINQALDETSRSIGLPECPSQDSVLALAGDVLAGKFNLDNVLIREAVVRRLRYLEDNPICKAAMVRLIDPAFNN